MTWSDFEKYKNIVTGSGLYILVYDLDENFELVIGGGNAENAPMYIRLRLKEDMNNYVNTRTNDVKGFIESNEK